MMRGQRILPTICRGVSPAEWKRLTREFCSHFNLQEMHLLQFRQRVLPIECLSGQRYPQERLHKARRRGWHLGGTDSDFHLRGAHQYTPPSPPGIHGEELMRLREIRRTEWMTFMACHMFQMSDLLFTVAAVIPFCDRRKSNTVVLNLVGLTRLDNLKGIWPGVTSFPTLPSLFNLPTFAVKTRGRRRGEARKTQARGMGSQRGRRARERRQDESGKGACVCDGEASERESRTGQETMDRAWAMDGRALVEPTQEAVDMTEACFTLTASSPDPPLVLFSVLPFRNQKNTRKGERAFHLLLHPSSQLLVNFFLSHSPT
ncbi:hypothetical protein IE53DRAFT_23864 [Violaceomyces palustris]|uniref:Uncharacterized protein n=1 Tax=Violaceomyces palustris TaxID=1673888 RepID=A0ACD0P7Y2_9BASI|nr:hypothetical protein IE53DRAFT_23864 [Violaceomyces palustris]